MSLDDYTSHSIEEAKELLYPALIGSTLPSHDPLGIVLGGQPASGKTALIAFISQKVYPERDFVVINGDEYRKYHPNYYALNQAYGRNAPDHTQKFANELVEFFKQECLRLRLDFVIEGTMRSLDVIGRTCTELKNAGFKIEAHVLAVPYQDSLIYWRYEAGMLRDGIGRFSPLRAHHQAFINIPINLDKALQDSLFDSIAIYKRDLADNLIQLFTSPQDVFDGFSFTNFFEEHRSPIKSRDWYNSQWQAIAQYVLARRWEDEDDSYLPVINAFIKAYEG